MNNGWFGAGLVQNCFQTFSNGNMFVGYFQLLEAPSLPKWRFGKRHCDPKYIYIYMLLQWIIKFISNIFKETNYVVRGNIHYIVFLMENKKKNNLRQKKSLENYINLKLPILSVVIFNMLYRSFKFRIKLSETLPERNVFTTKKPPTT